MSGLLTVEQVGELRDALSRARLDLLACREEMEVSTQEEMVDAAIARIDVALEELDA